MQGVKGHADVGRCLPIHTCEVVHRASDDAVAAGKAVTVLTYLHGLKEVLGVLGEIQQCDGLDVDLIELRSLKPLDMEACRCPAPPRKLRRRTVWATLCPRPPSAPPGRCRIATCPTSN